MMTGGIFNTHCESDVTYWPLDTQTCYVNLTSWAYTANEVSLVTPKKDIVRLESYQRNCRLVFTSHVYIYSYLSKKKSTSMYLNMCLYSHSISR